MFVGWLGRRVSRFANAAQTEDDRQMRLFLASLAIFAFVAWCLVCLVAAPFYGLRVILHVNVLAILIFGGAISLITAIVAVFSLITRTLDRYVNKNE
jgi:hypothetical protein